MTGSGEPSNHGRPSDPAGEVADDRPLVVRIAAREDQAFREAIEQHAPVLHRIAYRMVGEPHEAEDIAQEAMLRLWDHAARLEAKGGAIRLGPWLKRVCVNLAIDRLRIAKRNSGAEVPERADEAPLADSLIEADEETALARSLVEQLPDRQRAAIILTYYEEQPNAEAAAVLDMNIKAFESLLHRARAALRKAFDAREAASQGGAA